LSFALGAAEMEFLNLDKERIIGEKYYQAYTNNFEENGFMDIKLILDNREYTLKKVDCHAERGRFSWTPPDTIPENSYGYFYYEITIGEELFTGETGKMKFGNF